MAISFNTALRVNASASFAFNNTAGANQILVMYIYTSGVAHTDPTATYNGVAMTRVFLSGFMFGSDRISGFILVNPAVGSNTLSISTSVGAVVRTTIGSYNGAKQTAQPDASNTALTTQSGDVTIPVTTVANGAWITFTEEASASDPTGVINGVERGGTLAVACLADTNAGVSPGSNSVGFNFAAGSQDVFLGAISLAPSATPSSIKTIDGLAVASVKTWDGLAMASVKTINGLQ